MEVLQISLVDITGLLDAPLDDIDSLNGVKPELLSLDRSLFGVAILVADVYDHVKDLVEPLDSRSFGLCSKLHVRVSHQLWDDFLFGQLDKHVDVLRNRLVKVSLSPVEDGASVHDLPLLADCEAILDREVVSCHVVHSQLLILALT